MRLDRVDRWLGPSLTLLALAWLWLVYLDVPAGRTAGEPGPRAFPILLGVVLALLGISMAVMALVSARRRVGRVPDPNGGRALLDPAHAVPPASRREVFVASATFGLLILYAFLLDKVGFLIGTPVVIALTMGGLLRTGRWVLVVSLAVGFTTGCWVIFDALLGTPLPRGTWLIWPGVWP